MGVSTNVLASDTPVNEMKGFQKRIRHLASEVLTLSDNIFK